MRVLADLHGGDLDNLLAKNEYNEIRDKVIEEVCSCIIAKAFTLMGLSERIWSGAHIRCDVGLLQEEGSAGHVITSFCATRTICIYLHVTAFVSHTA